jgi:hypothetical protein
MAAKKSAKSAKKVVSKAKVVGTTAAKKVTKKAKGLLGQLAQRSAQLIIASGVLGELPPTKSKKASKKGRAKA